MKLATLILSICLFVAPGMKAYGSDRPEGVYNLYLYFGDGKPFVDELTLIQGEGGSLTGSLHVPNDFDAGLESVKVEEGKLSFHVSLPEKYHEAYPDGLDYELQFRQMDYDRFVGFVNASTQYVGSVVGFRK